MEKFKKYVFENDFCSPPHLDSDDTILKSWLKEKISRIGLDLKNPDDKDYTQYEIQKIKELFTNEEINNLWPQDWKSDIKKNWKIYSASIIGLLLLLRIILKFVDIFYLFLIVFLIVWNVFLKSLTIGFLVSLFGDRIMVKNKSITECYDMYTMGRNKIQAVIVDGILVPFIIYVILVVIF